MPRPAKPFIHQGSYYTTAGGKWRKLCPVSEGVEAAYRMLDAPAPTFPLVGEAAAAYVEHCRGYYTLPGGRTSSEPRGVELALSFLSRSTPGLTTAQLTKEHLKAAVALAVKTCSRKTCNQHLGRIKRAVKWWLETGWIPDAAAASLLVVQPLPAFRSGAKEYEPVTAVAWEQVEPVLRVVAEPWASLILLQWYTGLRPGEACGLKVGQVEAGAKRLNFGFSHKTGWRGRKKEVPLGPRALDLLTPWLDIARLHERDFVFATAWTARAGDARPALPGSYTHAVERACEKLKLPVWSPNQIRHSFAERVRAALGLEAAQHALGHARADVTEIYASGNRETARKAVDLLG